MKRGKVRLGWVGARTMDVQVVAPEWVTAYEPDGDRAPLGLALGRVLARFRTMELMLGVFVHRDRRLGRWWTRGFLIKSSTGNVFFFFSLGGWRG